MSGGIGNITCTLNAGVASQQWSPILTSAYTMFREGRLNILSPSFRKFANHASCLVGKGTGTYGKQ